MCCLNYEARHYQAAMREAPRRGSRWRYADREWFVERVDLGNYRVYLEGRDGKGEFVELTRFQQEAVALDAPRDPAPPAAKASPEPPAPTAGTEPAAPERPGGGDD
jgi:hypothetical protein